LLESQSLKLVLNLLDQGKQDFISHQNISFDNKIEFNNVNFTYNDKIVLNNLNFTITKGKSISLIGKSGSGKSTLLDILMGLIEPSSGEILIDNMILNNNYICSWNNKISHVSQSVFLLDASILFNITKDPSISESDSRLQNILNICDLNGFINGLNKGIKSQIGENGIMISGGQRQRIALARALYKDSEVVILDEATSALDEESEFLLLNNIIKYCKINNITLIITNHRKIALELCDLKLEITT
jgi:ABC-type bacteriocin/lantibiotic exporter with double-glycine peptidase domain